ncbi:hypothetical protein HYFRA_00010070 [Hymenoscyphus fraxineus]|uniref:Uncharacterized protein n=1 Tax=Hymenoscyphus fraxineus TaxID=746836 RepID=A0A9N9KV10_9HELO|nr:hypothetical protein HYFRA_00010070 [Hymenoscyphus fraxineus]
MRVPMEYERKWVYGLQLISQSLQPNRPHGPRAAGAGPPGPFFSLNPPPRSGPHPSDHPADEVSGEVHVKEEEVLSEVLVTKLSLVTDTVVNTVVTSVRVSKITETLQADDVDAVGVVTPELPDTVELMDWVVEVEERGGSAVVVVEAVLESPTEVVELRSVLVEDIVGGGVAEVLMQEQAEETRDGFESQFSTIDGKLVAVETDVLSGWQSNGVVVAGIVGEEVTELVEMVGAEVAKLELVEELIKQLLDIWQVFE